MSIAASSPESPKQLQQPLTPEERDISLVIGSENSEAVYLELAQDPLRAQAMLERSERNIAKAGSDLETGLRYKKEKAGYEKALEAHKIILGLAAKNMLLQHPGLETREDIAKRDVIDFMIESKRRIIENDIHRRLEISRVERAKERLARSKAGLVIGSLVLLSGSSTAAVGAYEAFETGPGEIATNYGRGYGLGALAVLGILGGARAAFRAGGTRVRIMGFQRIKFYAEGKEDNNQRPSSRIRQILSRDETMDNPIIETAAAQKRPDKEAVHKRLARHHIKDARQAMAEIAMDTNLQASDTEVGAFICNLVDALEESLDQFYRVENPNPNKKTLKKRAQQFIGKLIRRNNTSENES